ncbi:uncharacterized protein LOC132276496 isoform X2 [Cornus florida]|uniref:uncharacterized protein LOC132276496 isoform X2 n=1 Tax=Cornus florida TaxID=4283 RepID=UPI0028965655|nr:uncharacterized protein LOC132276496 isoform X2 [Cornus florida]
MLPLLIFPTRGNVLGETVLEMALQLIPLTLPYYTHTLFRSVPNSVPLPTTTRMCQGHKLSAVSLDEIPPNALRRKCDPSWRGGFSLGLDLGMSRTGLALSKGFSIRPLTVLELRGQKLELRLLEIAERQEVDEFIIGLPKSHDGAETPQSNKVRSIAGRLAVRAAERGWRVYLQDEHGTSTEAMSIMIDIEDMEEEYESFVGLVWTLSILSFPTSHQSNEHDGINEMKMASI